MQYVTVLKVSVSRVLISYCMFRVTDALIKSEKSKI